MRVKQAFVFAILLVAVVGCDTTSGPSVPGSGRHDLWPYKPGDGYTIGFEANGGPFLIEYDVATDTIIDGVAWQKQLGDPNALMTLENSPDPIFPTRLALSRVSGDSLFIIRWSDSIILDLSGRSAFIAPGFKSAERLRTLDELVTPAGIFTQVTEYESPGSIVMQRIRLAPGVGIVSVGGDQIGDLLLRGARIGWRSWP